MHAQQHKFSIRDHKIISKHCAFISVPPVSVVAINGNIIDVGAPYCETYDAVRFSARARVFESCKDCVTAWFGA